MTGRVTIGSAGRRMRPERIKELTLLGLIAASVIIFGIIVDGYLSGRFFNRVTTSVVIVALLAVGQSLVIISRNIDLSVGSAAGFAAYVTADFLASNGNAHPLIAVLLAMAVGAVLGSFNGLLVSYGGVPAIIVTLGTLALFRTGVSAYAGGENVTTEMLPEWVIQLNSRTLVSIGGFDIRLTLVVALAVVVVLQLALARMRWGRRLYAIGSNPDAAEQAGLPTKQLVFWSFVGSGAIAGLAGFMFMVRIGTISATAGSGLELESVAAAVVGGVSILGGSGTMVGALLGALLIETLKLSLVRVPEVSEFWRDALLGILVLGAVILDSILSKRFTAPRGNGRRDTEALDVEATAPVAAGRVVVEEGSTDA